MTAIDRNNPDGGVTAYRSKSKTIFQRACDIWGKQELSRQRRVVPSTIPQIGTDHAFPGTFSTALQCLPGLALATLASI